MVAAACTVIVVNFRSGADTVACLASIDEDVEVIVVDNASGDGSPEVIRRAHPRARVLERADNDGFGAGVNAGAEVATGDVLVVLNPDCVLRPGALALAAEYLDATPGCGIAAPTLVTADGVLQPSLHRRAPGLGVVFCDLCAPVGYLLALRDGLHPSLVREGDIHTGMALSWASGAALAIRREAFVAAGGFDAGYFLYFEDVDLSLRIAAAGFTVDAVREAVVVHRGIGDADHLAPSVHWFDGARRFLRSRGIPDRLIDVTFWTALVGSRVGLRLMALASRGARPLLRARAAAYDRLSEELGA